MVGVFTINYSAAIATTVNQFNLPRNPRINLSQGVNVQKSEANFLTPRYNLLMFILIYSTHLFLELRKFSDKPLIICYIRKLLEYIFINMFQLHSFHLSLM